MKMLNLYFLFLLLSLLQISHCQQQNNDDKNEHKVSRSEVQSLFEKRI